MTVVRPFAPQPDAWPARGPGIRPATAVQWAMLALVAGNVGRIPIFSLGERAAPLLFSDLMLGFVLTIGALAMLRARTLRLDGVALTALAFATIGGLSAVASVPRFGLTLVELAGGLAYLARWIVYFVLYVVVINCVRASDSERVWGALEAALLAIAAFGIVQAAFLPDFAFMVYGEARPVLDWDIQGHRLVSTVLEPNVVAAMLAMGLIVQVARVMAGVRTPAWKPVLMLAAIAMTLSRSGMLSLIVGLGVVVLTTGVRKQFLRVAGVAAVVGLLAAPKLLSFAVQFNKFTIDGSALARLVTWQRSIMLFLEYPWIGVGFNTYGYVQEHRGFARLGAATYSAEGGLLFIAVMTGVVGLAVYLVMLWRVFSQCRDGWRNASSSAQQRGLYVGTAGATAAILVHSVFVNSLLVPFVMEMLWVLWGLVFLNREASRHARTPVTSS